MDVVRHRPQPLQLRVILVIIPLAGQFCSTLSCGTDLPPARAASTFGVIGLNENSIVSGDLDGLIGGPQVLVRFLQHGAKQLAGVQPMVGIE